MIRWWKLLTRNSQTCRTLISFPFLIPRYFIYLHSIKRSQSSRLSSCKFFSCWQNSVIFSISNFLIIKKEKWQNSERKRQNNFSRKHPAREESWKLIDFFLGKSLVFARKKKVYYFFHEIPSLFAHPRRSRSSFSLHCCALMRFSKLVKSGKVK